MKFSSIKEYFYKLQSRCYLLILLPMMSLIVLYLLQRFVNLSIATDDTVLRSVGEIVITVFAIAELTSVHLVVVFRMKQIRAIPSMATRLDQYAIWITIKMIIGVTVALLALGGWMYLQSEIFIASFAVALLFIFMQRPSPEKLCTHLQLRGDEQELIMKGELRG